MKIYISGPMRGHHDYNRAAFNVCAERLAGNGHHALNPAIHDDGWTIREYMLVDVAMLSGADAVLMLPGWETSKGAKAEKAFAEAIGLPVHLPETPVAMALEWGEDEPPKGFIDKLNHEMHERHEI